jgi:hypothetical protein
MNVLRVNAQTYNTDIQGTINATGYYLNGVAFTGAEPRTFYDIIPGNGNGLRFWQSDAYKIHMGTGTEYQFGPVTDYSIKMNMDGTPGRGWTWGIAGLTPIAAMNINGDMQIAGSFTATALQVNGPSAGSGLTIRAAGGGDVMLNPGGSLFFDGNYSYASGNYIKPLATNTQGFFTSGAERMRITPDGNVGIGVSIPGQKLHVASTGSTFVSIDKGGDAAEGGVTFNRAGSVLFYLFNDDANNALKIQATGQTGEADATPRMQFPFSNKNIYMAQSGGNVGIGTDLPNYKLDVNGPINATAVYVNGSLFTGNTQWTTSGANIHYDAGNVGVGTASPLEILHIKGSILAENEAVITPTVRNRGFYSWSDRSFGMELHSANGKWSTAVFARSDADIRFGHYTAGEVSQSNLSTKMTIQENGNVGIGTATPYSNARLHLKAPSATPWGITAEASWNTKIIGISHNGTAGIIATGVLGNDTHSPIQFQTADTVRMTINENGTVGIGTGLTTNPNNYILAVNGKVGAKEVRVEKTSTSWPDYVFDEAYVLPELAEVERYIQEHKHLKDVPSAIEVDENGHELGSMDAILLKKIEELTLYIIEQQKKINALETAMKEVNRK